MAPLQVDPPSYLKPHHSAGRCPGASLRDQKAAIGNDVDHSLALSSQRLELCARHRRRHDSGLTSDAQLCLVLLAVAVVVVTGQVAVCISIIRALHDL